MIEPHETVITGRWISSQGGLLADGTCQKIADLIQHSLIYLGRDTSGWDALYRDPNDGRHWELIYPESELHGGGPPQLRFLTVDEVKRKFGDTVDVS